MQEFDFAAMPIGMIYNVIITDEKQDSKLNGEPESRLGRQITAPLWKERRLSANNASKSTVKRVIFGKIIIKIYKNYYIIYGSFI